MHPVYGMCQKLPEGRAVIKMNAFDMLPATDTLVEMFPHTDGILDMFPQTGDIHSGVSGHVESVCLLSKIYSNER